MKQHFLLIVVYMLISYTTDSLFAGQTNIYKGNKIEDEILSIIEGNQATLDSVHSLQGKIAIFSEFSVGTEKKRQAKEFQQIWFDGNRFRRDILESKFVGPGATDPITIKYSEDRTGIVLPGTPVKIVIDSPESNLSYFPKRHDYGGTVILRPGKWELNTTGRLKYPIFELQSVVGYSLKEKILKDAEQGYHFHTTSETIDGENCIRLTCDYDDFRQRLNIWVVPSKGFCIKKFQSIDNDKVVIEYETTLKQYAGGIWWFETVKSFYHSMGGEKKYNIREVLVEELIFNEPIDPKTFTLAGTDIPHGTRIKDKITGIRYDYGLGHYVCEEDIDLALDAIAAAKPPAEMKPAEKITPKFSCPKKPMHNSDTEKSLQRVLDKPRTIEIAQSKDRSFVNTMTILVVSFTIGGVILVGWKYLCKKG